MDRNTIRQICMERLAAWLNHLVDDHSTPVLVLGIGHDHRSGSLSLSTLEAMPNKDLEKLLQLALEKLDRN